MGNETNLYDDLTDLICNCLIKHDKCEENGCDDCIKKYIESLLHYISN
ncbi:hypothetical protein [Clostridium sp.]|nr:hypothetical protein [Clostridium sp.]